MELQKQNIPLSFSQGLDTKSDKKQLMNGKFISLTNVQMQTLNEFRKRNGFSAIATNTSLSAGNAIASYNNELVVMDGSSVYSYSVKQNALNSKGTKIALDLQKTPVIHDSYQQTTPTSAYTNGIYVYAWSNEQNPSTASNANALINYSVVDAVSGQTIVANTQIPGTALINPQAVAFNGKIVLFYLDYTSAVAPILKYRLIDPAAPTTLPAAVTVLTLGTVGTYQTSIINQRLFIIAKGSSTQIKLQYLDASFVQSSTTNVTVSLVVNQMSIFGDDSNNVWIYYENNDAPSTYIRYQVYTYNMVQVLGETTITIINTSIQDNGITGIYDVSIAKARFLYNANPASLSASESNRLIYTATGDILGFATAPTVLLRSVRVVAKPFLYNNNFYIPIVHESTLQTTYFIANMVTGVIVGKIEQDNCSYPFNGLAAPVLPNVNQINSTTFEFPYCDKGTLLSVDGNVFALTGISDSQLTFNEPIIISTLGNNTHFTGAIMTMYDGSNVVEHGFNLYPEDLSFEYIPIGGALKPNQYQYSWTYEWTDFQGQIHRSAPSIPLTVNLDPAAGATIFQVTATATNTNPTLTSVSDVTKVSLGALITGPGIPAGTYIIGYTSASIVMSANATASTTAGTFSLIPNYKFTGSVSTGSITMVLDDIPFLQLSCSFSSLSTTLTVNNSAGLIGSNSLPTGVGLIPDPNGNLSYFPANDVVTAVDSSLNQLTLSQTASTTKNNAVVPFGQQFKATYTNSSATLTNVDATFRSTYMRVGQTCYDVAGNSVGKVVSLPVSPTTSVVLDTVYVGITTGNVKTLAGFRGGLQLTAGQTIIDANSHLVGGTYIKSISADYSSLIMSTPAIDTAVSAIFSTKDVVAIVITVPTLRLTDKTAVSIVGYRTEGNGTIFYRITPIDNLIVNDKTIDSITYYDALDDVSLVGNQLLYTTGGVVDNIPIPAVTQTTLYKNRIIGITEEDPLTWWASKQTVQNTPVEFSDTFQYRIDERGGKLTTVAALDEKLIFFKHDNIFYLVADGPAPTGANDDFTITPQLIASDVGCTDKRSVVIMPMGLMFKSAKGIYLLDRGLNVKYIGADVESYNNATVTSAKLMDSVNQVRFTLDTGVELVYDYYVEQWSTWTNLNAADSCIFENVQTFVTPSGSVKQETPGTFTDDGSPVLMSFTTSWLSFIGIQGFQRAYHLLFLGEYKSPHTLSLGFAYDFNSTISQTVTIPVLTDPIIEQFRVFLQRQKCQSVQITLSESQASNYGEGLNMSAFAFRIGMKKGLYKKSAAASYG